MRRASLPGCPRSALLPALALLLAACQPAAFVRPDVPVPASWPRQAEVAQAEAAASLGVQPWREILPAPELHALIEEALAANADLRIAIERIELARAQYGVERAALFPGVDAAASVARERMPGFDPRANRIGENAVVGLSMPAWEIDLWGRLAARSEAARREVLASAALADGVRTSLVAQVSSLYLDLLDLDAQHEITRRTLDGRRKALRLTRARFDEGVSSILDVRQAESLLAGSEQALADQARRIAQTENALAILLGRNPGPIARSARLDELRTPARLEAGLPAELLQRRPDIRAAEQNLRAAGASVEAARKAFLPRITLTTLLGFASTDLGQLFDSDRYAWSLQPTLGLPLFDGGRLQAGVEVAEAQQRILVEQYKATIRQAFREVADALVAFERLTEQRAATRRLVHANRERLRVSKARYLAGISSYFEVIDAERQLFDSELGLAQATRGAQQAVVQLYRALGGGAAESSASNT
ncbi:MAG TPA: efflux transporter outer membrane subunit [Thauera aminoaromatica]|jgi:multidrug efflux system outer membrane protein|uniref:RND efflux system, outer membrane lipoprotein, NodT family n=1 Tax=Thauera aminoaromatica TaxID=164330 RepID=C4KA89_THASP|nr:efflux transporter outer membrane subunit [Thauera aminoaromatica]OPZ05065.1 MAG: Outer membrane protein OprM precursor [Alphaproteobacteria bacterium ADurb.BinA305]ACR01315.1 RND efflux system, outer membrane lipoprotein, NodT family [Thauera aminoaromatica]MCK6397552.1 efflux transporter outer membrane subunit [Thauera aminoaromatica]HNC67698.1 efflux transporter outer membrane subunit [Thauera aminoaromatica]HPV61779.1 efflux transporter outer membrane subunit [Thauera aminoaromatica]